MVGLVLAITRAESWGFGDARTLGLGGVALAVLGGFVVLERRHATPLVRLGLLRTRTLATANVAMLLAGGAVFGMFFFGSLYLQRVLGLSPIETGLGFLPFTAAIVVGAGCAQQLVTRLSAKEPVLLGLLAAGAGLLWYARLDADGSYAADVLGPILLVAFGMGNVFVALTLVATAGVRPDEQGLASGVFTTSQQVGGALGLAVLSTVAAEQAASALAGGAAPAVALVDGYALALLVAAGLVALAFVAVAVALPRRAVTGLDPAAAVA
jgi:predicted MFS family arabinose efflux permease